MSLPTFKAVLHQRGYYSLRVIYPESRLPGDGSSEFGRLRMERDGWNAWGDEEDFGRSLRAACHRAGRRSSLETVLAEIRETYLRINHADEMPDGGWTTLHGPIVDVTGDDTGDFCQTYALTLIYRRPGAAQERPTLIYMNAAKSVRMTAVPYWDAAIGETYTLTVQQAA